MSARLSGTIVKLLLDKGFGFIVDKDGIEYFFHRSAVPRGEWDGLRLSQHVSFIREESPKGPRAADIDLSDE